MTLVSKTSPATELRHCTNSTGSPPALIRRESRSWLSASHANEMALCPTMSTPTNKLTAWSLAFRICPDKVSTAIKPLLECWRSALLALLDAKAPVQRRSTPMLKPSMPAAARQVKAKVEADGRTTFTTTDHKTNDAAHTRKCAPVKINAR